MIGEAVPGFATHCLAFQRTASAEQAFKQATWEVASSLELPGNGRGFEGAAACIGR